MSLFFTISMLIIKYEVISIVYICYRCQLDLRYRWHHSLRSQLNPHIAKTPIWVQVCNVWIILFSYDINNRKELNEWKIDSKFLHNIDGWLQANLIQILSKYNSKVGTFTLLENLLSDRFKLLTRNVLLPSTAGVLQGCAVWGLWTFKYFES